MKKKEKIIIVGSGLAGLVSACYLAKRGYIINLYDKRNLFEENNTKDRGKASSIDICFRGKEVLKELNIMGKIEKYLTRMNARKVYIKGNTYTIPFGKKGEIVESISREIIHNILLKKCLEFSNIEFFPNYTFKELDTSGKVAIFESPFNCIHKNSYDILIGADGVHSKVRYFLEKTHKKKFTKKLEFYYKEFSIPQEKQKQFNKCATYMWPGEGYLCVAHPNSKGTFEGTVLITQKLHNNFGKDHKISADFSKFVKDLSPKFIEDYSLKPLGKIYSLLGGQWNWKQQAFLIGDAAHAMIPFLGQGMNSAFEDGYILNDLLNKHKESWEKVIFEFSKERQKDGEAIVRMSNNHCPGWTLKDWEKFIERKNIELLLSNKISSFIPYTYFIYSTMKPYQEIKKIESLQTNFIKTHFESSEFFNPIEKIDFMKLKKNYEERMGNIF